MLHGACSYRSISPTYRVISSKPACRHCCCRSMGQANGWTDGQMLDRYIDPAPYAMQAASITQKTIMLAAITQPLTCESTNNIRYLSIGIQQYITCVVPISRSQLVNQERMRPVGVVPRSESLLKFLQCFDTVGLMTSKASRYVCKNLLQSSQSSSFGDQTQDKDILQHKADQTKTECSCCSSSSNIVVQNSRNSTNDKTWKISPETDSPFSW